MIQNAVIESVQLDMGGRGLLTCWLMLDYGGAGQGFGGYALYLPKSYSNHQIESLAGHFLYRCMEIAGVDSFDKLPGRSIRVRGGRLPGSGPIEAIGHIVEEDWFCPEEDFAFANKKGARK